MDQIARELLKVAKELVGDYRTRMNLAKEVWKMLPPDERLDPSERSLRQVARKLGVNPIKARQVLDEYNLGM